MMPCITVRLGQDVTPDRHKIVFISIGLVCLSSHRQRQVAVVLDFTRYIYSNIDRGKSGSIVSSNCPINNVSTDFVVLNLNSSGPSPTRRRTNI